MVFRLEFFAFVVLSSYESLVKESWCRRIDSDGGNRSTPPLLLLLLLLLLLVNRCLCESRTKRFFLILRLS
jgi:hypothetical protein